MHRFFHTEHYIVLNLSGVDFIDSSGIASLIRIHTTLDVNKSVLWLYRPAPDVMRALENTHMDELLHITNDPEKLVEKLKPWFVRQEAAG